MNKTTVLLAAGLICVSALGASAQDAKQQDIPDEIVKKVDPSVVCIMHERACGSGFVLTKDGYILSNGHVVRGEDLENPLKPAKTITVITHDEKKYPARVVGFCMNPDVSLIKIEPESEMRPVEFCDTTKGVKVGEKCFAVGAPLGLKRTFTSGMLSSVDRSDLGTFTKVFQTDAAINQGNSGGPLFDASGRVLGINTYAMGQANNLGFTIPSHVIQVLKDHFLKYGRFMRADIPLCIWGPVYDEMAKALNVEKGVIVDYVMPGTSADKAGLKAGDIVTAIDGKPCSAKTVAEMLDIEWDLTIKELGAKVMFTVLRGSGADRKTLQIPMTTEESEPVPDTSFPGEIITCRNDSLGVGFRQMVKAHRVMKRIEPQSGVILDIQETEKNGSFDKAGLRNEDIVTKVGGKPVADPASFTRELLSSLARKDKYIDITASRQKAEINTTVAPYYDLKGKKIALVMTAGKSEYLDLILLELLSDGADITIVEASGGASDSEKAKDKSPTPAKADAGGSALRADAQASAARPDMRKECKFATKTLKETKGAGYNAVLFLDCPDGKALCANADALRVVKEAYAAKRVLAAMGASALLLPAAEEAILKKKITASENVSAELIKKKANYTGSKVEKDDTIVTTTGFDKEIVRSFLKTFRQIAKDSNLDPAEKS